MSRDRMPDLLQLARTDPATYNEPEAHKETPLDPKLAVMFGRVSKVSKFLKQMKDIIKELGRLHDRLLLSASYEQEEECRNLIQKLGNRFGALARKSKSVLRRFEMDEDVMKNYAAETHIGIEKENGIEMRRLNPHIIWHRLPSGSLLPLSSDQYIPAEIRMRFHLHSIFTLELTSLVREYYIIQKIYGDKCREKIKRQMEIIGREIEESQLDDAIHRREKLPLLHHEIVDDSVVDNEMRAKLREVEVFHQEILKLESSIEELHKAFVTISTLIYEQGDIVDRVEQHVSTSADYIEDSNELLKKASGFQHKYRKKKCILAIIVAVVIAILVIIIVVSVKKHHAATKTTTKIIYVKQKQIPLDKHDETAATDFVGQ